MVDEYIFCFMGAWFTFLFEIMLAGCLIFFICWCLGLENGETHPPFGYF